MIFYRLPRILLLLLSVGTMTSFSYDTGHQCDWSGSGLSPGTGRGVRPVYLRCRAGTITWSYPRGALRVLLRLPVKREFRACIKPSLALTSASLFLEAPNSLTNLFSPSDTHLRCFDSRGGQAALYVEASDPQGTPNRQIAEFSYDLSPIPRGKHYQRGEECRPCSKEEMTEAFCTSELVVRGIIQRVEPVEGTDISEIRLKPTKTLREATWTSDNEIVTKSEEDSVVVVEVGKECGAHHGDGEVVVMARRRLGSLVLTCAPRLHEWITVARHANRTDTAHCLLTS